jgi:hypothetical protein
MKENKNITEKKPVGKPWNFPLEGITIFAKTREEALKELSSLQKKSTNSLKS